MKRCKDCEIEKPLTDFPKHKTTRDGRNIYCRLCMNLRSARWRQNNPESVRQREADNHLKRQYGLTRTQYDAMVTGQLGVCPLCLRAVEDFPGRVKALVVDHCHETGEVRGLLCRTCNAALHAVENYPGWTERAAAWLLVRLPSEVELGDPPDGGVQLGDSAVVGQAIVEGELV